MKRAIIALIALTIAAPAVADQVAPGTLAARQHFAQSDRVSERLYIDGMNTISNEAAMLAEDVIQSENGEGGTTPMFNTDFNNYANAEARRILNDIAAEEEGGI